MSPQSVSPQPYNDFSADYQAHSILLSPSETVVSDSCLSYCDHTGSILMPGYPQSTPQTPDFSSPVSKSTSRISRRNFLMKSPDTLQSYSDTCNSFQSSKAAHTNQIQLSTMQPTPLDLSDLNQSARKFSSNLLQHEEIADNATTTQKLLPHPSHIPIVSAAQKDSAITIPKETKLKMELPLPETSINTKDVLNGNKNKLDGGMKQDEFWFRSPKSTAESKSDMTVRKKILSGNLVMSITNGGRAVLTGNDLYKNDNIDDSNNEDGVPTRPKSAPGIIRSDDAINALRQVIARRASMTSSNTHKGKNPKRLSRNRQLERPIPRKASTLSSISNISTIKPSENALALTNQQIIPTRPKDFRRASYSLFGNYDKSRSTGRRNSPSISKPSKAAKKSPSMRARAQSGSHSDETESKASLGENRAAGVQTPGIYEPPLGLSQAAYAVGISSEKSLEPCLPGYGSPLPTPAVGQLEYSLYQPYQEHQQQMQLPDSTMGFGHSVPYQANQAYQSQLHTDPSIPSSEQYTFPYLAQHPAQSVYNGHESYPAEYSYTLGNYYHTYPVDHFYQQQPLHGEQDHLSEQRHSQHQCPNNGIGHANNTHMIYLSYQ